MYVLRKQNAWVVTIAHTLVQIALYLFNCSTLNHFVYVFVYSIARWMISHIALGHYPVTNSNGTCLNYNTILIVART